MSKHPQDGIPFKINCPFDMQAILNSCCVLRAYWTKRPFTLDINEDDNTLIVRHIRAPNLPEIKFKK